MPSGDARIDFEEEVSPGKDTLQSLVKTVIPFLLLVLTKVSFQSKVNLLMRFIDRFSTFYLRTGSYWLESSCRSTKQFCDSTSSTKTCNIAT